MTTSSSPLPKVKSIPKTIEECLHLSLVKIKKYFRRVDTNNFSISIKYDTLQSEVNATPNLEKALQIYNFVKQACKEKKRFFDTAKYEYINLDENFDKLKYKSNFNQANFIDLIEKCKMLLKCQQDDNLYIEKLKQEIIILNSQKNAVIEKTTETINKMKKDQLDLEGITSTNILETYTSTDITCENSLNWVLTVRVHLEDTRDTLTFTRTWIVNV